MKWRHAPAVALIIGLTAACTSATPRTSMTTTTPPSSSPIAQPSSARPLPSQDAAAIARTDAACVEYDRQLVARGRRPTISAGYAVEAAAEQEGRWVLVYGTGTSFVTCAQESLELQSGANEFYLSDPEPWATQGGAGAFRSCTNDAQATVFYCVGQVDAAATEVVVDNPPDASVRVVSGAGGRFVASFPYVGTIRREGRLGDRLQISFFDSCGHQFVPITMGPMTPCPRPS